jgi:hypothetical protein
MSREQAETYLRLPQRCSVRATVSPEEVLRLMI